MYTRLFRNRNFVALWLGQLISFIGDYFVLLAVPIVVNRMTGSALMVGLTFIAGALPALLLGPVAGVFIDRWDRRKVMIVSDLVRAALVLINLLVRRPDQIWIFYLTSFLLSCTSQFFLPARNALLPRVVNSADDLLAANGLMQIIMTVGFLAGPALAGFAIGQWGESVAFVVNSVGYLVSAGAVLTMSVPHTSAEGQENRVTIKAVTKELFEGLNFVFTNRSTLGVMIMLAVAQLGIGTFMVIWIPFLQRYFNQGAQGVGLIDSLFGMGMVVGGAVLGVLARRVKNAPLASICMLLMGLLCIPMGATNSFTILLVFNFLFGIAFVPMQSALTTIIQLAVPDLKLGRVSSSQNAVVTAAGLIAMAVASLFADLIGLRTLFYLLSLAIALSGVLGFWLLRDPETGPVIEPQSSR